MNRKESVAALEPIRERLMALVVGDWLRWGVVFLAMLALFATPLQMMRLVDIFSESVRLSIAGLFAITVVWFAMQFRLRALSGLVLLSDYGGRLTLAGITAIGLGLRLGWILMFPAQPGSDAAVYLELAQRLAAGMHYEIAGTRAYWPPGFPLFLAPLLAAFDNPRMVYLGANLVLYVVATLGVYRLAHILAGDRAGRLAALLFAVWPNLVFAIGTPEKESLVLCLLPWATYLLISSSRQQAVWTRFFGTGLLLGFCTLVQPSLQFLVVVAVLFAAIFNGVLRGGGCGGLALILGAALVVAPWTYRNYQVFDSPVLVATNGGSNLYRANNPLATGGYMPKGAVELDHLEELEHDRVARRLAVEWIVENPGQFLKLLLEKQVRFMGDDAVGIYNTFKVGGAVGSDALYAILKAFSNAWWMSVWFALAVLSIGRRDGNVIVRSMCFASIWLWLYLFAIHSIFESAGKYHFPVTWVPCVLLPVMLHHVQQSIVKR